MRCIAPASLVFTVRERESMSWIRANDVQVLRQPDDSEICWQCVLPPFFNSRFSNHHLTPANISVACPINSGVDCNAAQQIRTAIGWVRQQYSDMQSEPGYVRGLSSQIGPLILGALRRGWASMASLCGTQTLNGHVVLIGGAEDAIPNQWDYMPLEVFDPECNLVSEGELVPPTRIQLGPLLVNQFDERLVPSADGRRFDELVYWTG